MVWMYARRGPAHFVRPMLLRHVSVNDLFGLERELRMARPSIRPGHYRRSVAPRWETGRSPCSVARFSPDRATHAAGPNVSPTVCGAFVLVRRHFFVPLIVNSIPGSTR